MEHYRNTSHDGYDNNFRLVWITKYRKPLDHGERAIRLRTSIRDTFKAMDVEIITGHVSEDRLRFCVSVLPFVSASNLV